MKQRSIVIPAVKKNAVIPDQLVKKLAGKTLIARALETALGVLPGADVLVVTDSDEIRLICERAGVRSHHDAAFRIGSSNIVAALRPMLEKEAETYADLIIYRPSSPLITARDIEDAYKCFLERNNPCLCTVKSERRRPWHERRPDLLDAEDEDDMHVETRGLFIVRGTALSVPAPTGGYAVTPYFLNEHGIEINGYLDWWVCEKILCSRHIVFVAAGHPTIGMGHIFRTLMLAHEIADHRVTFVCTKESEFAASSIAARDYHTKIQGEEPLWETVLRQKPDMVINDILNTSRDYIRNLKDYGIPVVNFEDEGPGAGLADLVVNALYEGKAKDPRVLNGHRSFCLRDEFLQARQNPFRETPRKILVTFGGTDDSDFTRQTLEALLPLCRERGISLSLVAGPGYAHKEALQARLEELRKEPGPKIFYTHATNVMSGIMEDCDLAVCSAGRTVYELAHMRIPAAVLAHHSREDMHTFARPKNGFIYLGVQHPFRAEAVAAAVERLLDPVLRRDYHARMSRRDFSRNKAGVMRRILALLPSLPGEHQ